MRMPIKKLELRRETLRISVRSGLRAGRDATNSGQVDSAMSGGHSGVVNAPPDVITQGITLPPKKLSIVIVTDVEGNQP